MPDLDLFTLTFDTHPAFGWTVPTAKTEPVLSAPEADADDTDEPPAPAPVTVPCGTNLYLDADRKLARGWPARARDNLAAIRLSKDLEASGRIPTPDEQSAMLRFIGFGATELAQNCFPLPGTSEFRNGWADTGRALMDLVSPREYATLQRATQYAHFTPEPIGRALWRAAQHLGFTGGRVLEPGMGTGLFFALLPPALRGACRLTGIEYEPVTARIARLVFPEACVRCEDYTRSPLGGGFDLAIGNPPFADRVVRADPTTAALGLRLHDYFIARSISRLRPGGIALFVTSTGTMDKANTTARTHIAGLADLIGAVRLPEASLRTTAGTDVVVDVLVFQRRQDGHPPGGAAWIDLTEIALEDGAAPEDGHADIATDPVAPASPDRRPGVVAVNAYFATHPEMVLGTHAQRHGIYGPGLSYTCRARPDAASLETQLNAAGLNSLLVDVELPLT